MLGGYLTDDLVRVAESVRDNPVTIARSGNDLGKSWLAARLIAWFYVAYPQSKVFATAAPPFENLKNILWGELYSIVSARPEVFSGHKIKSLGIYRNSRSFIVGVAIPTSGTPEEREAKFSGKHAPQMLFVVDEGDAVPEEVYKGIEACMSGGDTIRLLIMFNPRGQTGAVHMMEKNSRANVVELSAFRHPNVVTGTSVIPGAVSREVTVRRINEWTKPLFEGERAMEDEVFEVPDFLVGETAQALDGKTYEPLKKEKRKIARPEFSYMVLGKYPVQSSWQLISDAWIDRAVNNYNDYIKKNGERPPPGIDPTMGIDLAEYGSDYNTACFRYDDYVEKPILWSGVDTDFSAQKAYDLYKEKHAKIAMADATGVGTNVAPAMTRKGRAEGIDVRAVSVKASDKPSPVIKTEFGEFYMLRDQLWWALREWLRTNEAACLPPDGFLLDELRAIEYYFTERGRRLRTTGKDELRKKLKRSTDRSDSLCLTFAPFERARVVAVADYYGGPRPENR